MPKLAQLLWANSLCYYNFATNYVVPQTTMTFKSIFFNNMEMGAKFKFNCQFHRLECFQRRRKGYVIGKALGEGVTKIKWLDNAQLNIAPILVTSCNNQ
jgi:hypothetical protein